MAQNPFQIAVLRPGSEPQPPAGLGSHGERLWRDVLVEFDISDAPKLELLQQAAESLDRAEALKAEAERDGLTIVSAESGATRSHPALTQEAVFRSLVVKFLGRLGVLDEPKRGPGRPPGKGAA